MRMLTLELIAEVLDGFADLAAAAPEPFLHVAGRLVGNPFVVEPVVVGQITGRLFELALELVALAVRVRRGSCSLLGALDAP